MIRYQLRCRSAHEFEGWYRSSDDFDRLRACNLLSCPECGVPEVERALMAPSVVGRASVPAETSPAKPDASPTPASVSLRPSGPVMPDRLRAMLTRLRETVERECDYVGSDFAREARRIHDGEIAGRAIFGEATDDEHERLVEDGVAVGRIPWLPRADG